MTEPGQDDDPDVIKPTISVEPVISSEELAQLRKTNIALEGRNYELRETVRQLRLQSAAVESERDQYKREAKKLKGELEQYRTPPLVIGTIEALASGERVIVRSTTGPQFLSKVSETVNSAELVPGRQCALHPQSFVLVEVLPNKYDTMISGMEVERAPEVNYEDIGGLDRQKILLREAVELPLLKPELFEKVGIEPPKGVLLVGPPGTGKTLLAKAVSHETNAAFIRVVGSELVQKYIGEGARLVRELFALAREKAPAIIFIDEIDAIGSSRSNEAYSAGDHEVNRTLMQLLSELDGFNTRGNVKIIAATNRMDILDQALLRPGRFDRIIEFPLPDEEGRRMILAIHTKKMHLNRTVSLEKIAKETENMNGSELMAICVEAGMNAVRAGRTKISGEDFVQAITAVKQGRNAKLTPIPDGMYS
ncbi:MAG: proteasome-activating nucleotidase [Methanocorpusculum sp.]|jgi:proteasome regulatory subunit|uniref:proteasome-activating nucleotidase n=1 Tax=unclassified Methanocorpusculum TaxID=225464 RepID=UPI001432B708|nr:MULTISPECIES: proteasome-activating nucleotidase [unclassified Methanocorpusculum]MDD2249025.1 proteasome-activating nucleotidase [Methanocorpusculum sp.]MDD2803297.1 proteasome-activating nucleotidase [Methanocorpusculum sp.]MDD3047088.1 proteasome-activating nucleotidase [Methanocorpusculum sp.]MDD3912325.1 proteasome-activating nucleotidase [Methanocorpusculum sp.]MDY3202430.1 proteasome-activating nucleotidase [Methanocorpusculum sp.]